MEILHTTGIHKQVGDPKKVRKKVPTFAPPQKVRAHLFSIFFSVGNTQMIAARDKTYIHRFGEETKKRHTY